MSESTVLLVHGGWGGPWCWKDFIHVLDKHGVPSVAPQLPSSQPGGLSDVGLSEDATAVIDAAASISGPIVLVGHSYGGAVVLEAASRVAMVERLVFVAALVPQPGQSATDTSREVRIRTKLDEAIVVDGEYLLLDPQLAGAALYNECTDEVAAWATQHLSSQTMASFRSPRTTPALMHPSQYISCTADFAIDPALQSVMSHRCDTALTITSDHSPMLSNPETLFRAVFEW